jgi:hypothetical protein
MVRDQVFDVKAGRHPQERLLRTDGLPCSKSFRTKTLQLDIRAFSRRAVRCTSLAAREYFDFELIRVTPGHAKATSFDSRA